VEKRAARRKKETENRAEKKMGSSEIRRVVASGEQEGRMIVNTS
jgi:hypothetical protein